ncbi:MAG: hypothetical protein SVK54_09215 [candidate division WOR-3 bacterium]|nr:hypothetical protein [candidate division WOR-3 bacterium]
MKRYMLLLIPILLISSELTVSSIVSLGNPAAILSGTDILHRAGLSHAGIPDSVFSNEYDHVSLLHSGSFACAEGRQIDLIAESNGYRIIQSLTLPYEITALSSDSGLLFASSQYKTDVFRYDTLLTHISGAPVKGTRFLIGGQYHAAVNSRTVIAFDIDSSSASITDTLITSTGSGIFINKYHLICIINGDTIRTYISGPGGIALYSLKRTAGEFELIAFTQDQLYLRKNSFIYRYTNPFVDSFALADSFEFTGPVIDIDYTGANEYTVLSNTHIHSLSPTLRDSTRINRNISGLLASGQYHYVFAESIDVLSTDNDEFNYYSPHAGKAKQFNNAVLAGSTVYVPSGDSLYAYYPDQVPRSLSMWGDSAVIYSTQYNDIMKHSPQSDPDSLLFSSLYDIHSIYAGDSSIYCAAGYAGMRAFTLSGFTLGYLSSSDFMMNLAGTSNSIVAGDFRKFSITDTLCRNPETVNLKIEQFSSSGDTLYILTDSLLLSFTGHLDTVFNNSAFAPYKLFSLSLGEGVLVNENNMIIMISNAPSFMDNPRSLDKSALENYNRCIFDISGRRIHQTGPGELKPGIYFQPGTDGIRKLIILK